MDLLAHRHLRAGHDYLLLGKSSLDGGVRSAHRLGHLHLAMIVRNRRGFVLLEIMLGVMVFALGVLALGRSLSNCVVAESARQETERARLALANRMAEVEADEISTEKKPERRT